MFKIGDRVTRVGPEWRGIKPGDCGVVVSIDRGEVRVRYFSAQSEASDGSFGQIEANISRMVDFPARDGGDRIDAMVYGMSAIDYYHARKRQIRENDEISALLESMPIAPKPYPQPRPMNPMHQPCPVLVRPPPPLGPDIGMFIRDGMTSEQARAALDAKVSGEMWRRHLHLSAEPKIRATIPGPRKFTTHRAPRQMGWINHKLGIGSSRYVLWGVAPMLDAFGM
jgi:hypothetical protein